jgi:hypothetical protein
MKFLRSKLNMKTFMATEARFLWNAPTHTDRLTPDSTVCTTIDTLAFLATMSSYLTSISLHIALTANLYIQMRIALSVIVGVVDCHHYYFTDFGPPDAGRAADLTSLSLEPFVVRTSQLALSWINTTFTKVGSPIRNPPTIGLRRKYNVKVEPFSTESSPTHRKISWRNIHKKITFFSPRFFHLATGI